MSFWKAGNRITAERLAQYEQVGEELVSFTSLDSFVKSVVFPVAFTAAPVVMVNISAAPGASSRWDVRAINVSATGFDIFLYSNAGGSTATWSNVPVMWKATAR